MIPTRYFLKAQLSAKLAHQDSLVTVNSYGHLLPPANEVCEGYVFTGVCLSTPGGACMVLFVGGMHGFIRGACVVLFGGCVVLFGGHAWFYLGGHAWFYSGGVHGFIWGVCVVLFGGMQGFIWGGVCGFIQGGHAWFFWGACVVFSVFSDTMRYGQ